MKLAKTIEQRLNVVNCIWNVSKGVSCGVAILIFNKDICIENYHSDFFGRVIKLDFSLDGFQNFRVVNAYFPSYYSERLDFISTFSQYLTGAKIYCWVVLLTVSWTQIWIKLEVTKIKV